MKKNLFIVFAILLSLQNKAFADTGIFWSCLWEWNVWVEKIRNGDIHLDTIPCVIRNWIDYFMGIAWTISVIFIIIWAYQMLFWSLQKDITKWRNTIIYSLAGFALAACSWLIIRFILDNFG